MADAKNKAKIENFSSGLRIENNSCRDMTLVTDGEALDDGIVELTEENEDERSD